MRSLSFLLLLAAFPFIARRLLGKSFSALSQLAVSSPPFRPDHTKLGK